MPGAEEKLAFTRAGEGEGGALPRATMPSLPAVAHEVSAGESALSAGHLEPLVECDEI